MNMKPCPTPACGMPIPEHYLPEMACAMCVRFGPPSVRRHVEQIERRKHVRIEDVLKVPQ